MSPTRQPTTFTLVIGVGYTGRRLLDVLPVDASAGLSRSAIDTAHPVYYFDLDAVEPLPLELPNSYSVVYTVPPSGNPDDRLLRLLPLLTPAPERFVYISTTGVYGDRDGARVTESTPVKPANKRSARRVAAEQLLGDWTLDNACRLIVLRAPGIYGPARLGIERIEAGLPVLDERSANPGNRIHVDDLVQCCVAAVADEVPAGLYNVGDGDHRSSNWFSKEVARQLELPAPPEISMAEARRQFSARRLSFMSESRIVDTTKMRDVLGVKLRYADPAEGIKASL